MSDDCDCPCHRITWARILNCGCERTDHDPESTDSSAIQQNGDQ